MATDPPLLALTPAESDEQLRQLLLVCTQSTDRQLSSLAQQNVTFSQLIESIKAIQDDTARGRAMNELFSVLDHGCRGLELLLEPIYAWAVQDPVWKADTNEQFDTKYESLAILSRRGEKARANIAGSMATIKRHWGEDIFDRRPRLYEAVATNQDRCRHLATLAGVTANDPQRGLRRASACILDRLDRPGKGIRTAVAYMGADLKRAAQTDVRLDITGDVLRQRAQRHDLTLTGEDVLVPTRLVPVGASTAASSQTPANRPHRPTALPFHPSPAPELRHRHTQSTPAGSGTRHPPATPSTGLGRGSEGRRRSGSGESIVLPKAHSDPFLQPPALQAPSSTLSELTSLRSSMFDAETASTKKRMAFKVLAVNCSCDPNVIPNGLITLFLTPGRVLYTNDADIVALLEDIRKMSVGQFRTAICHKHLKVICRAVGLRQQQPSQILKQRLERLASRKEQLPAMRIDPVDAQYSWFRTSARPTMPHDALGPYAYFHKAWPNPNDLFRDPRNVTVLRRAIGMTDAQFDEWTARGTLNLSGVFDWLKESRIQRLIDDEFDMYAWHLREINGRPNRGWLRNMVYSLVQQAVRMDVGYWMLYVICRPDHRARLISYPYYAKKQQPGEETGFHHVDQNIDWMVQHRRGVNMVQGTVSLDDEHHSDCTELVPGMHHHIVEWRRRLEARQCLSRGYVQGLQPSMLTDQDLKDFHTAWESVPCKASQIRITMPHLPHGAKGPSRYHRRTIMPWYIGIEDDHHALETTQAGTWEELAAAHRDFEAPPRTPSGHANMYGKIPCRFPATARLPSPSAIGNALVGRIKWDSPDIRDELRDMFLLDQMASDTQKARHIKDMLAKQRGAMRDHMVACMEKVVQEEQAAFEGYKSYFRAKAKNIKKRPRADVDAAAAYDDREQEDGESDMVELEDPHHEWRTED